LPMGQATSCQHDNATEQRRTIQQKRFLTPEQEKVSEVRTEKSTRAGTRSGLFRPSQ